MEKKGKKFREKIKKELRRRLFIRDSEVVEGCRYVSMVCEMSEDDERKVDGCQV